jgi:hypothetical protein
MFAREVCIQPDWKKVRSIMVRKLIFIAAGVALLLAVCVALFVVPRWPFREKDMKQRIAAATGSTAEFSGFRQVFFPNPGCVIEKVTLTPKSPGHPKVQIQKLVISGLYSGLIGQEKHLHSLELEGLQVIFPPRGEKKDEGQGSSAQPSDIRFDEIRAQNSQVVFLGDAKHPETELYDIYRLLLKDYSPGKAIHFNSVLRIPEPPAEVEIVGDFGPYASNDLGAAPLAGSFTMKHADLSKFHAFTGTLTAQGKFEGKLGALQVNASTDAPQFGLTDTGHAIPLRTEFSALVNGTNGDIKFEPVHASLGETKLVAQGQLASDTAGHGKVLTVDSSSDEARIQDLMYLFVQSKPPLQGATRFQAKVRLPSDSRTFEKRVEMKAHFGIKGSRFTAKETQQKVGELSESARGNPKDDDPAPVVTDLLGDVELKNATATFSQLSLRLPGASAVLHGTYKLENKAVDLHGTLQTDVKLSKATTGFKAFLMKVVEAAKAKKKEGATVPVKVTGTYDKPEFGLDATSEK